MRLQERPLGDPGGGPSGQEGYGGSPKSLLPPKVANVSADIIKKFSHTKRVGNYLLGKTLGEGSFAKVKEGLHTLTGEKVAVKVIDKKKAREDVYVRKNLRREGKLLQMVRHRHVVRLFEIMETENSYYLVTELCNGGDLMEHICNRKRLDEKETRKYIRQILSAVNYLHKLGILHRDLKVENLLLDENKNIKIIDFGLSNSVEVTHNPGGATVFHEFCVTQCGSPAYAAPELLGNNKYGPNVDIWSIGVNMFAMLTGSLPFTVEPFNIKALHKKMLKGDMNPTPDHLTKHCRDLLKRFLNPDPDLRITIQEAMKHPWICEVYRKAVDEAPFPNRLCQEDLCREIIDHMTQRLDFQPADVVRLVTGNIPNSATAAYFLLSQRLSRHEAEVALQARISKAVRNSHQQHNDSNYEITGNDVIELMPISDKEQLKSQKKSSLGNIQTQEPRINEMPMSPRRLPRELDDRPSPAASRAANRRSRHQPREDGGGHDRSPGRGGGFIGGGGRLGGVRDASPRRPPLTRGASVEHSPRGSPRPSPRRGSNAARRGSLEPARRGSLLPRSASQETEGSSVAPSDIILPDLEPEVGDDVTPGSGQMIHLPLEGQRSSDRAAQQRVASRGRRGSRDQMNLPAVSPLNRRPSFEYSTSPEPRHRLGPLEKAPPTARRGSADRNTGRAELRESDRLSPCVINTGPQRTMSAHVGDGDYRKSQHSAHSSTTLSVGRQSALSNPGGGGSGGGGSSGGGGVRPPMIHRADDQTAVRSDQSTTAAGRTEWRSARPAAPRSAYPHSTPHPNPHHADKADAMPRKLVIDVNQYDRYARATGRIRTIASADPEPVYISGGGHRRLINLMYPTPQHQKPRHLVPKKSHPLSRAAGVTLPGHQVQHGERAGGDHLLGVSGERASPGRRSPGGGGAGGGLGRDVMYPHLSHQQRQGEAVSEHLVEMTPDLRGTASPVSRGPSRSPSPAHFRTAAHNQKVELPAISPTPGSSANTKMHIEDLDK